MNISEIAKLAGVSNAAVSRYLNGGSLSQEKREQIKKVIEKTGYQPDTYARMLRTGRLHNVGVIVPKINSESVSSVTEGISDVLSKNGYMFLLGNTNNDEKKEIDFIKMMQKNHLAGIILMGTVFTEAHRKALKECRVPAVVVGQRWEGIPSIYHDDYHAAGGLAALVCSKGRKRIGFIGAREEDMAVGQSRRAGIEDELARRGSSLFVRRTTMFSVESGYEEMKDILQAGQRPDSVICATDTIAFGAMKAAREAGLRIPEDIGIAGFGDGRMSAVVTPELTTVRLYYRQSGMEAAKLLLEMLENSREEEGIKTVKQTMLSYEIIDRGSA